MNRYRGVLAYTVLGYTIDGAYYCTEHAAPIEESDLDTGHATPVFASDESADDLTCSACLAEEIKARGPRYLDESRITERRLTTVPRTRQRQDGYGNKIPTCYMLQLDGKRWHRVYCVCWSNAGSLYVTEKGQWLFLGHIEPRASR